MSQEKQQQQQILKAVVEKLAKGAKEQDVANLLIQKVGMPQEIAVQFITAGKKIIQQGQVQNNPSNQFARAYGGYSPDYSGGGMFSSLANPQILSGIMSSAPGLMKKMHGGQFPMLFPLLTQNPEEVLTTAQIRPNAYKIDNTPSRSPKGRGSQTVKHGTTSVTKKREGGDVSNSTTRVHKGKPNYEQGGDYFYNEGGPRWWNKEVRGKEYKDIFGRDVVKDVSVKDGVRSVNKHIVNPNTGKEISISKGPDRYSRNVIKENRRGEDINKTFTYNREPQNFEEWLSNNPHMQENIITTPDGDFYSFDNENPELTSRMLRDLAVNMTEQELSEAIADATRKGYTLEDIFSEQKERGYISDKKRKFNWDRERITNEGDRKSLEFDLNYANRPMDRVNITREVNNDGRPMVRSIKADYKQGGKTLPKYQGVENASTVIPDFSASQLYEAPSEGAPYSQSQLDEWEQLVGYPQNANTGVVDRVGEYKAQVALQDQFNPDYTATQEDIARAKVGVQPGSENFSMDYRETDSPIPTAEEQFPELTKREKRQAKRQARKDHRKSTYWDDAFSWETAPTDDDRFIHLLQGFTNVGIGAKNAFQNAKENSKPKSATGGKFLPKYQGNVGGAIVGGGGADIIGGGMNTAAIDPSAMGDFDWSGQGIQGEYDVSDIQGGYSSGMESDYGTAYEGDGTINEEMTAENKEGWEEEEIAKKKKKKGKSGKGNDKAELDPATQMLMGLNQIAEYGEARKRKRERNEEWDIRAAGNTMDYKGVGIDDAAEDEQGIRTVNVEQGEHLIPYAHKSIMSYGKQGGNVPGNIHDLWKFIDGGQPVDASNIQIPRSDVGFYNSAGQFTRDIHGGDVANQRGSIFGGGGGGAGPAVPMFDQGGPAHMKEYGDRHTTHNKSFFDELILPYKDQSDPSQNSKWKEEWLHNNLGLDMRNWWEPDSKDAEGLIKSDKIPPKKPIGASPKTVPPKEKRDSAGNLWIYNEMTGEYEMHIPKPPPDAFTRKNETEIERLSREFEEESDARIEGWKEKYGEADSTWREGMKYGGYNKDDEVLMTEEELKAYIQMGGQVEIIEDNMFGVPKY